MRFSDIDGGGSVAFRGEVITVPTRGPGGSYPPDPIPLRIKWLHVDCSDGYCWEHDPGGYSAVWIVILTPQTHTEFNTWVSENTTNAAWLQQLPQPPSKITIDADGNASLPSAATSNWNAPEKFPTNNFMHPKAVYELRSKPISNNHGHQATYDAQGCLITEGIKSGTADYVSPSFSFSHGWHPASHRKEDVHPFIRALQLDGNPVRPRNSSEC